MLGDPLGRAGIGPCTVRTSTVRALCRGVWAHTASSRLAALNWATAVSRSVLLGADGTLGPLGLVAVGSNVAPLPASKAKCVWSLLKGVDLIAALREPNTSLAKSAKDLLAKDGSHHRRATTSISVEAGPGLSPTQPSDLCWDLYPSVLRLKLLPELLQTSTPPHIALEGDVVDTDPLPSLLGNDVRDVVQDKASRPQYHVTMLKEVLGRGSGRSGAHGPGPICTHSLAVLRASFFLSTITSALNSLSSSHTWASAVSLRPNSHLSLILAVRTLPLFSRISCPPLSMGLASKRSAKEACRWSSSALAGGSALLGVFVGLALVYISALFGIYFVLGERLWRQMRNWYNNLCVRTGRKGASVGG